MKLQYITDIKCDANIFPYDQDAINRLQKIYRTARKGNLKEDKLTNLKDYLANIHKEPRSIPSNIEAFDSFAKEIIKEIAIRINGTRKLKFGIAQKIFNLFMKDLWAWDKLKPEQESVLHWPIDKGVLDMVRKPAWKAWTKVVTTENNLNETFNEYLHIQNILRSQLLKFPQFHTAIEMEQYLWHKFELINQ
ncbi:MAG: hypothetical protein HUU54_07380 [Ignavibacteriaceae bacterium]|nr:hypothetical protein [Ignavibacteriaceae bacterium]